MAEMLHIAAGSDTYLELQNLTDTADDTAITGATVTATLYDDSDDSTLGSPVTLADEGAGLYRGTIAYNHTGVSVGVRVRIEMTATGGGLTLRKVRKATVREEQ